MKIPSNQSQKFSILKLPPQVGLAPEDFKMAPDQEDIIDHFLEFDPEKPETTLDTTSPQPLFLAPRTLPTIPWPTRLKPTPKPLKSKPNPNHSFEDILSKENVKIDILIVTWTVAEALALSDVLTPGYRSRKPSSHSPGVFWYEYKHNWSQSEKKLQGGAPALKSKRLGIWFLTKIGKQNVLCYKSELHMARDGKEMPVKDLWKQLIGEIKPSVVITTGTAGGIGKTIELGDVVVTQEVRFDCKRIFNLQDSFKCTKKISLAQIAFANKKLMAVTTDKLPPAKRQAKIIPKPERGIQPDKVVSTDFFAFDDAENHFELQGLGSAVEMGDATLGLACKEIGNGAPAWVAVRNASDPQIETMGSIREEADKAGRIYEKYGYWTTVNSAIACWSLIASMK